MPTRPNVKRVARRARLLGSVTFVVGLWPLVPAVAQNYYPCTVSDSCTVEEGADTTGVRIVGTGNWNGYTYFFTNNADITASTADQSTILYLQLDGAVGNDDGGTDDAAGYAGAPVNVNNNRDITLQGGGGDWSQVNGIFVQAKGGYGVEPGSNGDGGRGGDSGSISITNAGTIIIDASAAQGSQPKVNGIDANASAGAGGDMNSGAGDQKGGNSGDAKTISINNKGAIQIGSESSPFAGATQARIINAHGDGSNGGSENGEGGAGATIWVTNNAAISLYWNGLDGTSDGVHGIYARSQGGNGIASGDNSDPGGKGESGRPITLTTAGDITIESSGETPTGLSAAMYAISQGGDGGDGPDNHHDGGAGGGASIEANGEYAATTTINVQGGATVSSSGAGIMGVAARSLGGNGGDGSDGTSGGAGGYGGAIQINFTGGATITTDGDEGYGILGQSVGGIGGSNASTAGAGGYGGTVGFYATSGTTITTQGDYAAGVTLHSIGGGGGVGGDFINVLAGDGGDGGNGGDAEGIVITSGADVTTHGQYAHGLLAQSIGGSGGAGGVGVGLVIALGGQGGEGGGGKNVIVNNTGAVTTTGYGANGILAQTLSGGGGAAGAAGGAISVGGNAGAGAHNSATAYVTNNNDVTTAGDAAVGILVQSIGGGGGTGAGATGLLAVGGSGEAGGNAGIARIFHVGGTVSTTGEFSPGLVAQSIGGGGGSGGNVIDLAVPVVGVSLGIGGSGEGGGYGGHACVSNIYDGCDYTDSTGAVDGSPSQDGVKAPAPAQSGSTIITSGDFSVGAMAQSIGGGGGNGGTANGVGILDQVTLQIGGSGKGGSDGRPALMTFDNLMLTTKGNNAPGLLTQSIGGGGGTGGNAKSADVQDILPVQVGGVGGEGGAGVEATTELSGGQLTTTGAHSSAVVAQSIGGGGGTGGSAAGYDATLGLAINTSVGASGGSGGAGGTVSVNITSTNISTGVDASGNVIDGVTDSHGVVAQSIGGGGGNGGTSVADAMTLAMPDFEGQSFAASIATSVGGKGGVAGPGSTAAITLSGVAHVQTGGDGSIGVLAQSIARGGGNGGSASSFAGTIGDADTFSADISTAVGNSGGASGNAGTTSVSLDDTASVYTAGDYSNAVVVQSIGGGGGNGGVGSANNDQIGGGYNLTATIGLGGAGGSGGTGGTATVDLADGTKITTAGSGARGVLAQSIGGGGGTGQGGTIGLSGSASTAGGDGEGEEWAEDDGGDDADPISGSVTVNIGSKTGDGMTGDTVSVTANGTIATAGGDADGILAQSIGGSGGLAGSVGNDAGSDSDGFGGGDEDTEYTLTASVGGAGGTGGDGKNVTLTHAGQITTTGDWADGIVAQSIGGGGGAGGTSTAAGSDATANIDLAIGGHGGAGGDSDEVNVTFNSDSGTASVSTTGYSAYGVLLQSIGGGGGQGGDGSDQAAGKITVGGGFGGSGGGGGNGYTVTVGEGSWASLTTTGDDSIGLVAQSIGGGGGVGGAGSSTAAEDDDSHTIDLVVGGSGGVGGYGGEIDVNYGGTVDTHGDRAHGIVAQSIGGGGGIGGAGEADSIASLVVGGAGGGTIDGGVVTVDLTNASSIHTRGLAAHGIVAQSIGGGGGIGGTASGAPLSFNGNSPGSYGDGHNVTVSVDGSIVTEGDYSYGVLAQSIGGGGGFGGNATSAFIGSNGNLSSAGKSGGVTVTLHADNSIQATGKDSIGIFAQSDARTENNGKISVTVNSSVTGGSGDNGAGVWIAGGKNNTLMVENVLDSAGNISFASITAASGVAVRYTPGTMSGGSTPDGSTLALTNYGTVSGSVEGASVEGNPPTDNISTTSAEISTASAAPAAARFGHDMPISVINQTGGLLTDAKIYEADVVNHGRLVIGDSGGIDATRITGDLTQEADGVLAFNADFAGARADRLTIDGDATLGGKFAVSAESVLPDISLPFLTVGGTLDHSLSAQSALFDYAVTREGNELSVSAESAHFAEPGAELNDDQNNVAGHLQEIWDAGGGSFGTLFGTLGHLADDDAGSYGSALSDMSPGVSGAAAAGSIATTQQHLDLLLSCPMFAADTSFLTETECGWAQAGGQVLDQKASGGISGFDTTTYSMQAGAQFEVSPDWFVGIAGGYDRSDIRGDDGRVNADGDTLYAGVSLKHEIGPWLLSGALAGSYGWYDNTRSIRIPGFAGQAEGDPEIYNVSARVRAAYTVAQDPYYVRPLVDLDLIYSHASGYRETGAGALDLLVDDAGQWSFHATPAVEVGTRVEINETTVMRAFAGAGVSFSSVDSWDTSARLASAPSGIGGFDSEVPLADVVGRFTAGLDLAKDNGFGLRVEYNGSFSDTYTSHGGSLRLSHKF